ncbi:MAG: tetratricopeptide repeat protein [Saccharothrix sp.]|nr:tetratricopeptide repeat protein [Saccharothrix sp.]
MFVGVGVDRYERGTGLRDLHHAVAEVRGVGDALAPVFEREGVEDATAEQVQGLLLDVEQSSGIGSLVLVWAGHAEDRLGLRLATRDARRGVAAVEVVRSCLLAGADQVLLVIDACQAGEVGLEATAMVERLREQWTDAGRSWVGLLMSCSGFDVGARDGEFGLLLTRLLRDGPRSRMRRLLWSRHNEFVDGATLGATVLEEWDGVDQEPVFRSDGLAGPLLPNPLLDPGAPEEVVEHLLLAARGGGGPRRSWFRGRVVEVDEVVAWTAAGAGARVVVGSAGTGKSAVVGRVVSLSNPEERARLAESGGWDHADPGERAVHGHVHLRGLTVDRVAQLLDGQLVRAKVLVAHESGRRNAAELLGAVQRVVEEGAVPPVVVFDGVDEARGEAFPIVEKFLAPLSSHASVIVSTRPLAKPDGTGVVEALAPDHVLDLDAPERLEAARTAIGSYVADRLRGVDARMDPHAVAAHLVRRSSGVGDRPFLLARIVVDQLCATPVPTDEDGWEDLLAGSIEAAFDADLLQVALDPTVPAASVDLARVLLTALTWAQGAGFPAPEWAVVATALARRPVGDEHLTWVLDQLGRYIVQDGEAGTAVYRLAHQALADHLRPAYRPTHTRPFDPAAGPVAAALLDHYRDLLTAGHGPTTHPYLWRYAWTHAATAGPTRLADLRELADLTPDLRPDLAHALHNVAGDLGEWGHVLDAFPLAVEAVDIYRELSAVDPSHMPDLAMALNNLGIRYSGVGRVRDAVGSVEEAVGLYRELSAVNPAYLPNLATALSNLGIRYSGVGRVRDAVEPTMEAVGLYRELSDANPAHLPDLATALSNLGVRYSEVGRVRDAVGPTVEAVGLYRELSDANPAYLPNLAMALSNLGVRYGEVGRAHDGVELAEEAVRLYRKASEANSAFLPDLAAALSNLGVRYAEVGTAQDALEPAEEAIGLYQELVAANPAHVPNLAKALNNLDARAAGAGLSETAERVWASVLEAVPGDAAALLLMSRASVADAGDVVAARWLASAMTRTNDDRVVNAVRQAARRHWVADPYGWGEAWAEATGGIPRWLSVDPELVDTAQGWVESPGYEAEYRFLADNPQLLSDHSVAAVEEALLIVPDDDRQRYRLLLAAAREHGVDAAYHNLLLAALADRLVRADWRERRQLLAQHDQDLREPRVRALLADAAAGGDQEATTAWALLHAVAGTTEAEVDAVFDALDRPESYAVLLEVAATDDPTSDRVRGLIELGSTSPHDESRVEAAFYRAVLTAVEGEDGAADLPRQAVTAARRDRWITVLSRVGATHHRVLALIPALLEGGDHV